jgi:hypothetical protein
MTLKPIGAGAPAASNVLTTAEVPDADTVIRPAGGSAPLAGTLASVAAGTHAPDLLPQAWAGSRDESGTGRRGPRQRAWRRAALAELPTEVVNA